MKVCLDPKWCRSDAYAIAGGLQYWWDSLLQKTFVRMRLRQQEIFSKTRCNILPFNLREVRGDDYVTCVGWLFFCCHKHDGIYNNNTIYCYLVFFFFRLLFVRYACITYTMPRVRKAWRWNNLQGCVIKNVLCGQTMLILRHFLRRCAGLACRIGEGPGKQIYPPL